MRTARGAVVCALRGRVNLHRREVAVSDLAPDRLRQATSGEESGSRDRWNMEAERAPMTLSTVPFGQI